MSNVIVKDDETLDSALRRRFKRNCAKLVFNKKFVKRTLRKPSVRRKKNLKLLENVNLTNMCKISV